MRSLDLLSIQIHVDCARKYSHQCKSTAVVFAPLEETRIPDAGDRFVVNPYSIPDPAGWGRTETLRELLCPECLGEETVRQKLNTAVHRRGR